jgi:hypothetical protein
MSSANFASPEFSEVGIAALFVAPSLYDRHPYVEVEGSWPRLHKNPYGAGRWNRANFALKLSEKSWRCPNLGLTRVRIWAVFGTENRPNPRSKAYSNPFSDSFFTRFSEVR